MTDFILRMAARLYLWALMRTLRGGVQDESCRLAESGRIGQRELDAIPETIRAHFNYQISETRILSERLARRYDVGMALNEATNRTIVEKQAAKQEVPVNHGLTDSQLKALEFQKEYLARIVKDA